MLTSPGCFGCWRLAVRGLRSDRRRAGRRATTISRYVPRIPRVSAQQRAVLSSRVARKPVVCVPSSAPGLLGSSVPGPGCRKAWTERGFQPTVTTYRAPPMRPIPRGGQATRRMRVRVLHRSRPAATMLHKPAQGAQQDDTRGDGGRPGRLTRCHIICQLSLPGCLAWSCCTPRTSHPAVPEPRQLPGAQTAFLPSFGPPQRHDRAARGMFPVGPGVSGRNAPPSSRKPSNLARRHSRCVPAVCACYRGPAPAGTAVPDGCSCQAEKRPVTHVELVPARHISSFANDRARLDEATPCLRSDCCTRPRNRSGTANHHGVKEHCAGRTPPQGCHERVLAPCVRAAHAHAPPQCSLVLPAPSAPMLGEMQRTVRRPRRRVDSGRCTLLCEPVDDC